MLEQQCIVLFYYSFNKRDSIGIMLPNAHERWKHKKLVETIMD